MTKYDVCIVGTGAAGGILAHQLAKAGLNVVNLEQGPQLKQNYFSKKNPPGIVKWHGIRRKTQFPPRHQDALFIHDLFARANTRSSTKQSDEQFRQFQIYAVGGLQNLWNGVSIRFSEKDMKDWPIDYKELASYYTQVERLITVCGNDDHVPGLPNGEYIPPKPFRKSDKLVVKAIEKLDMPDSYVIANRKAIETRADKLNHCVSTGICTYGCPANAVYKFSTRLLPQIAELKNYRLITDAKVTKLIRYKTRDSIRAIEYIDTKSKKMHSIQAKVFVLCAGAIETPRILFNSADDKFTNGLANTNQTLGQYLQDNPKVVLATSLLKLWFARKDKDIGYGDLLLILAKSKLDSGEDFSFIGHSISAPPDVPYYLSSLKYMPTGLRRYFVKMVFHSFVTFGLFCEGDLMAENCVKPSTEVDKYGIRQVDIHYRSSDKTIEKMQKMAVFGRKVLRRATATMITQDFSNDGTGIHYAGTCRMGSSDKQAIVDKNLKTFAHDNLYLCDGGVIPHLPDKHLTLTIMALAARLASHLTTRLRDDNE